MCSQVPGWQGTELHMMLRRGNRTVMSWWEGKEGSLSWPHSEDFVVSGQYPGTPQWRPSAVELPQERGQAENGNWDLISPEAFHSLVRPLPACLLPQSVKPTTRLYKWVQFRVSFLCDAEPRRPESWPVTTSGSRCTMALGSGYPFPVHFP